MIKSDHVTLDIFDVYGDDSMRDYFQGGPQIVLLIVSIYLLIVLYIGPQFMKNRLAYTLSSVMRVYNLINILLNMGIFVVGLKATNYGLKCFQCTTDIDKLDQLLVLGGYYYLKMFDLLDTVFFVLRKKHRQVTRLHVVHHAGMPCMVWIGIKFYPYPPIILTIILNSFVHIVMYSYYYLSTNFEVKGHLWWKKYITLVQMVQLVILFVHGVVTVRCLASTLLRCLATLPLGFLLIMIHSFRMFYNQNYVNDSQKSGLHVLHTNLVNEKME